MGRYTHLTLSEREEIMLMRHEGRSQAEIARATGRDRSTISREMRRNSFPVGAGRCYRASTAQRSYEARRLSCVRPRILDDEGLAGLVTRLIVRERWSPEQIAGRIGVERTDMSTAASTPMPSVAWPTRRRPRWRRSLPFRAVPPSPAARHQREHQRPGPRVLPQGHRLRRGRRRPGPGGV
ncbi:IS30 family transposase [Bifidobacterium sp. 64T4]|nr:IS30 family transposase [Bifidobacterium pongonis]